MPRLHTAPDVMKAAFIQDTDPVNNTTAQITALGAVTAGKIWIDTTGGGWVWKRRSADNLSWITRAESAAAAAAWGAITGTIGTQTDLQNEFNKRVSVNSLGTANGIATLDAGGKVPPLQLPAQTADTFDHSTLQAKIERGAANGYAPLGADLKVPAANLPAQTSGGTTSVTGGNLVATSGYASLEAAFAAINATAAPLTTLMVNSVIPLVGSTVATLVQPANITLYFVGGGRVNR
ncbi:MAG TPA: hypothetical protein VNI84_19915, partial [Pyrinomonadaceae bacterium]|nr:hypothetical protein [Pyrinomonadaceae bacterium]